MAGDDISIADLMPAPHLEYFSISPEGVRVLEPYPRLMAWLKRVQERPSVQATGIQQPDKQKPPPLSGGGFASRN